MRKRLAVVACVACVVCVFAMPVRAELVPLTESTLEDLLGTGFAPVDSVMVSDMTNGNLHTEVYSQAFLNNGLYAYVYQVNNTGVVGNSILESFTLAEFLGTVEEEDIGYLTSGIPTGFLTGGQQPWEDASLNPLPNGLDIAFYYSIPLGVQIDPGEHSTAMYILSEYAPGEIVGSVINGFAVTGPVVGPVVPEPGTLVLLIVGGLTAIAAVWIRRGK